MVLVVAMLALSVGSRHAGTSEPATAAALTRVATQFNHDYQTNDVGPVWERFDDASRALITEVRYLRWHHECPASPGPATTLGVTRAAGGWWIVEYSIGGVRLHDYWHRQHGAWRFSLVRSNPAAARAYESTFAHFALLNGCAAG